MAAISSPIYINLQQVLHDIGYGADSKPSARIVSLINEYLENANDLVDPSYSYVIRDIKSVHGSRVIIGDSIEFESEIIARLLEQSERVAVFAVTIGSHLEELTSLLAEDGLIVQAAVLDAIGSEAAEKVADFVQDRIAQVARAQGLTISRRFSPGYCDWDVSQQTMVFRAMIGDSVDVRLTEGCLMLPQKSISGIIGIGPREVENYNPCKTCDKHDCVGRR